MNLVASEQLSKCCFIGECPVWQRRTSSSLDNLLGGAASREMVSFATDHDIGREELIDTVALNAPNNKQSGKNNFLLNQHPTHSE